MVQDAGYFIASEIIKCLSFNICEKTVFATCATVNNGFLPHIFMTPQQLMTSALRQIPYLLSNAVVKWMLLDIKSLLSMLRTRGKLFTCKRMFTRAVSCRRSCFIFCWSISFVEKRNHHLRGFSNILRWDAYATHFSAKRDRTVLHIFF